MSPANTTLVRRVTLREHHRPRGRVHYFFEGKEIAKPAALEIVSAPGGACHIIYLGSGQEELTESWHPTVDAALFHAKGEYGIEPEEWENLAPGARGL
ncbi:MAG: hypothetical protein ACRDL6_08160 [Solirubrobacterales bacterium]